MRKNIPTFESEDEEREFWGRSDSSDYVDWDAAEPVVFAKLKPTSSTILSEPIDEELKVS